MSTCPEKELISVYIDGEMPEKFVKDYEQHLFNCSDCRREYEKMLGISKILRREQEAFNLPDAYLDESFKRLQTKMNYAKNVGSESRKPVSFHSRWVVPFAAAAAVFAVMVAPASLKNKTSQVGEVKAIARTHIKPLAENRVVVDGNIDKTKIVNVLGSQDSEEEYNSFVQNNGAGQKVIRATNMASFYGGFSDIDVFRPDFNNSPVSVKIEIPNFYNIPENKAENFENR